MKPKDSKPQLVFVYLGSLPDYVEYSLILNSRHNKTILLCDSPVNLNIPNLEIIDIREFYDNRVFNNLADDAVKRFRNGFWVKTVERFYVLAAYMKQYKVEKVFHGEVDNLVFGLGNIAASLDLLGKGLFYPALTKKIAGASLMYVNSLDELSRMCMFINMQKKFKDDMALLAEYSQNSKNVFLLPSENNLNVALSVNNEKCIFDVASVGQYLFGIDFRNSGRPVYNRYQNMHCTVDLSKYIYKLDGAGDAVFLESGEERFKMINLHIHSKIFKKMYKDPDYFRKIVERLNRGSRTLISINVQNFKYVRSFLNCIRSF